MKTETVSPKEKLFETAARLFYQHGYRAVGVDTIAAQSGIGKMTLYRHFTSKDDLIAAYLYESDRNFWRYFEQSTQGGGSARDKLLSFFQALQDYVTSPDCYGCPFNNVASEFPEPDYPGHQIAREHKQSVRNQFLQLTHEAGANQPDMLADALLLLMDGAYMAARMYGASAENPATHIVDAARQLIDAQCGGEKK